MIELKGFDFETVNETRHIADNLLLIFFCSCIKFMHF